MWVDHIFLLDDLWDHFSEGIVLSLEKLPSFLSGCVHTEHKWSTLVGLCERVQLYISISEMSLQSHPCWFWYLVIEQS